MTSEMIRTKHRERTRFSSQLLFRLARKLPAFLRSHGRYIRMSFIAVVVGVTLVAQYMIGPPQPFLELYGIDCALCGATRAVRALLAGRISDAMDYNVGAVLGIVALLCAGLVRGMRCLRPVSFLTGQRLMWAVLAWTIMRNLPGLTVLASTPG